MKDMVRSHKRVTEQLSRRQYLASSAAIGTASLAGCIAGGGGSGLTVGFAVPSTGSYTLLGTGISNGFRMYVEQQDGEIDGQEVEIVERDTEGDTNRGVDVARELLVSEQVDAIVGPASSSVGMAMMQMIETEASAIWLNANVGDYRITEEGCLNHQFRTSCNGWQTSAPLAEFVYEEISDNICLAYADYAYGQNSKEFFKEAFEDLGGEVVADVAAPRGTEDYSPYLGEIESSGADAVFSHFAGGDAVNYINQFSEFGLDEEMVQTGTGFLLSENTLPTQGESAEGMYSILHYSTNYEGDRTQEFVENYNDMYDGLANVYACQGYDAAQAFAAAVEETGGTDLDEMADALGGMELDSPRGDFQFNPDTHDPIHNMYVREVVESDNNDVPVEHEIVKTIEDVEGPNWGCSL